MTTIVFRPYPVPALPSDLQTIAIQRRLGVSPSVARTYADYAYGDGQRGDLAHLAAVTANRIASYTEACQ